MFTLHFYGFLDDEETYVGQESIIEQVDLRSILMVGRLIMGAIIFWKS